MKRALSVLLVTLLLLALPLACLAQQAGEALALEAVYLATASSPKRSWNFPYDDLWFASPASEYQHGLAQASLGMALSAFRDNAAPTTARDRNVRAYLTKAGFNGLQSDEYSVTPTVDTIATMIGHKTVGDFTLLAVAVSGGGYQNEWLSNFTIGDEPRHAGFNAAAQKVQRRIRGYLEAYGLTGSVKLWISGYSRAAAVSNITAADMADSGLFADVFAYTFATPRTTKQRGDYKTIFNIVGKFDPVPCVPFADWGYERYGTDLYTPAQETDSDYFLRQARTQAVSMELTGAPFWNNPEINNQVHTIMDYMLSILPTSAVYAKHMQPIMLKVWQDKSITNLSAAIAELMENADLIDEDQQIEVETLLDYLSSVTYSTMEASITGAPGNRWNAAAGMTGNIAHEHVPDVYISWMFSSDDPAIIFTDTDAYMRFVCGGNVTLWLLDETGRFLWRVDPDGKTSSLAEIGDFQWELDESLPVEERPVISSARKGTQTIITLPKDSGYLILFKAHETGMLSYFGTEYAIDVIRGSLENVHLLDVEKDEFYFAYSDVDKDEETNERIYGVDDFRVQPYDEDFPYSPSFIVTMENLNVYHLSFQEMALLAAAIVLVTLALLTLASVKLVKRRRRRRRARLKAAECAKIAEASQRLPDGTNNPKKHAEENEYAKHP